MPYADPTKRREYHREYQRLRYQRIKNDPTHIAARKVAQEKYREENPDKRREQKRRWWDKNKGRELAKRDPEKHRANVKRYTENSQKKDLDQWQRRRRTIRSKQRYGEYGEAHQVLVQLEKLIEGDL